MKKKELIIVVAVLIIIFVIIGVYWFRESQFSGPVHYENPNIPSNLLYPNKSDIIPEEYLITQNGQLDSDLLYFDSGKFYCNATGEEADKIDYFKHSPGHGMIGGWYYRYAIICGDNYWIIDADDSFGEMIYGPFEK